MKITKNKKKRKGFSTEGLQHRRTSAQKDRITEGQNSRGEVSMYIHRRKKEIRTEGQK